MPQPFVAYLRVYEPLSSIESTARPRLAEAAERPVEPVDVGSLEQRTWLRTQVGSPPRLLPGETGGVGDVLVLHPADVPTGPAASVGPGPLVCPLDLRGRSAAAIVGFLASADVVLRTAALPVAEDTARSRASNVVGELSAGAVHVLSSTWTVPLPWFVLIEPADRSCTHELGRPARVCWRTAMADARRRAARAHAVARDALGEDGPTKVLREIGRWLERFHPHSAVELDYGGLVRLMDRDDVEADTSAEDVHAIVDAMELGDTTEAGERYESLRAFWAEFAEREQHN